MGPENGTIRALLQTRVPNASLAPGKPETPVLTCVVEVPRPLVVVGLLREHGLGHQLLRLVVQAVV